jgi:hypothetical protein
MSIRSDMQVSHPQSHGAGPHREPGSPPRGGESDRQRLRANCLAAVAVLALLLIGGWAENGLVNAMRDSGTCYRPGGSDCAAIYIPTPPSALTHSS